MSSITSEIKLRIKAEGEAVFQGLGAKLNNLANQTTISSAKFKVLSSELRQVQQNTGANSIKTLKDYAASWRELANSVDIASKEFKEASAEAATLEAQLAKAQGRRGAGGRLARGAQIAGTIAGASVFGGVEGGLGAGIGAIVGGVPGAITGGAIGAQVGQFRQALAGTATYAAEIAKQRQALQLVTKDTTEYRRALQFIDKTSRDLAIPQEILTRQFTQLTASVKGAGGNVKDAEKAFIGVASGIRGTGGSLEQLDSALTATSQVFSKGKVSAEELRQQIGERLPGAFSLFAESMGKTPQELDKALENGEVSLQDFQKFAEKLFAEYGENAKIIADGPDAAGDRLRTSLSRLSESIGSLLKPIGASFQNTFANIVIAIDAAIRKLNQFFGLGKGRQGEINVLQRTLDATDKSIRRFEVLGGKGGTGLGPIEKGQYKVLVERRTQTFAQMSALLAAEMAAAGTIEEPSKGLPGITPEVGKDKNAGKAAANALASSILRTKIIEKQAKEIFKVAILEDKINDELENQNKQRSLDLQLERDRAKIIGKYDTEAMKIANTKNKEAERLALRYERNAKLVALQLNYENESKKVTNEKLDNLGKINIKIADAQLQTKILTDEDKKRVDINRQLAAVAEEFYGKITNPELLEALKKLREALEGAANSGNTFKDNFKASFKTIADSALNLGANLGSALGNTFVGLADQLVDFAATGKATFADFTRSVLIDLSKIFARAAIFQTLKAIFPGTSAIGGFLGFANGGIMTANGPLDLKRYAAGGIANSPQLAMFGEGSRPEAYVPLPDGRTIPVTVKGETTGNIIVNVDATGSNVQGNESQGKALAGVIGAAVQAELVKQKKPGGLLY